MAQMNMNTNMNTDNTGNTVLSSGWVIRNGIIGGILGGIVFAMAEMIAAWITQGNATGPLHMIASIPIQKPPDQIDETTAIVAGVITHMILSMAFGIIVAFIVSAVPALRATPLATVVFASVAGLVLWLLDFYVIAPLINVPWFAQKTDPVQQFLWHTFAFGTVLGLYLASQLPRTVVTTTTATRNI